MENRKVRYTKRVLRESLEKLLRDKRPDEITVKELCRHSDINRSTFYAHYEDMDRFVEEVEDDLVRRSPIMLDTASDTKKKMKEHISFIREESVLIRALSQYGRLPEKVIRKSLEMWEKSGTHTEKERAGFVFLAEFFTGGMLRSISAAVESQRYLSDEELGDIVSRLFDAMSRIRLSI